MAKKVSLSLDHKNLVRRYLLWAFKTTKEGFERIERKTTQLSVDEFLLKELKRSPQTPKQSIEEFETYIRHKRADELKLKYQEGEGRGFHPQYLYLKERLAAIEKAVIHFLGAKELRVLRAQYEKEFTDRILQAREHA